MKKHDMDFIVKFAAASSAAFLLSGCASEIESGPAPDSSESAETQDSAVSAPAEQLSSQAADNAQAPAAVTPADRPAFRPIGVVLYGPPPSSTQNLDAELELSAIYWNPKNPIATINDENYTVGDKVSGHTIIEIRKTEIVLRNPMGEEIIKGLFDQFAE